MAFSFFGGIHPKENKWYTCDKEIQIFPDPDILVIPMSQHIGAPCKPLVKKGDLVTAGQKIGDNQGLCVPVHSPVSGKVKAVEMRAHIASFVASQAHVLSYHALFINPREGRVYCDLIVDYDLHDWEALRAEFTEYMAKLYPHYSLELVIETEYV